jgi:hypothetical protein
MLKINLLPPYVREKKRIMLTVALMTPLLLVVVAGIIGWWLRIGGDINKINAQREAIEGDAREAERLQGEIATVEASNRDMLSVVEFIESVRDYNLKLPGLLETTAKWTYAKVQINALQLGGSGPGGTWDRIDLSCTTDTIDSLYAAMENLWNATHLFGQASLESLDPSISYPLGSDTSGGPGGGSYGPPSFGSAAFGGPPGGAGLSGIFGGEQAGFQFQVSYMLKEPIPVPELGAAAGAAGGAGPGPGPGAGPGMGPGMGGGTGPGMGTGAGGAVGAGDDAGVGGM